MARAGFFRMEGYGVEARAVKGQRDRSWRCIRDVVHEMVRAPGAAPHISGRPRIALIAGENPEELAKLAIDQARQAQNWSIEKPAKLRRDGTAAVGCVASFPYSCTDIQEYPDLLRDYYLWRDRVVDWATSRWKECRYAIVEHLDEAHYHLHVLLVPPMDDSRRLDIALVHPAAWERDECYRRGEPRAEQNAVYKKTMRALQDDYYAAVSAGSGHLRKSAAPRIRRSRRQALIDREQNERRLMLNELEREMIIKRQGLDRQEAELEERLARLAKREAEFVEKWNRARSTIEKLRQRDEAQAARIGQLEKKLTIARVKMDDQTSTPTCSWLGSFKRR